MKTIRRNVIEFVYGFQLCSIELLIFVSNGD